MKFLTFIVVLKLIFVAASHLRQKEDNEPIDSNKIPDINIHMEERDRDPINYHRFYGARLVLQDRLHEVMSRYQNDKRALMHVITAQQQKIEELIAIASATVQNANRFVK